MIALVQRPRRKMHLAASHGTDWWTVCDRIVPDAGAVVIELDLQVVGTIDAWTDVLCAECHRMIVFAGTVAADRAALLLASLELAS